MHTTKSHVSRRGKHEIYQSLLLELITKLVTQFYSQNTPTKRPGRPPTYPIEIILLATILLKDKLRYSPDFSNERVFNIKEYHTIVEDATGSYFRQTR